MKTLLILAAFAGTARAGAAIETDLGEVRACAALPGGDFLVATGGGLAHLDAAGGTSGVWTSVDGLPGTRVESITQIAPDELWVGTEAGAARVRLGEHGALAIGHAIGDKAILDVARIDRCAASPSGDAARSGKAEPCEATRYFATRDAGVLAMTASGTASVALHTGGAARLRVSALATAHGELFAGTGAGLYHLLHGRFEPLSLGVPADVTALFADGDTLWIGTTRGLYARDASGVTPYGGGEVRRIAKLDGAIVVAGLAGAARADRGRLIAMPIGASPVLTALGASSTGAACAGGLGAVWIRTGATWTAGSLPAGPPANDISALATDGDRLWVGTFDHGLALRERGTWRRIADAHLDTRINAILVARDHRAWIGTAAGLSIVDNALSPPRITQLTHADGLPARAVLALAQLADGRVLAGTTSGAVILGDGRPVVLGVKQNLDVANVWAVAQDPSGTVWLGTTTGLYRGKLDDETPWQRFAMTTGHLRDDWVMALVVKDDALWVGTYKGGVTRFELGTDVHATPISVGWINPGGLRWDGANLYVSTMAGLFVSDGASAGHLVTGLPGKDVTSTARIGKTLYVSTRRGLAAFAP
ncbi:MAG TPA: two-component regulator propeller domain-containing protein [Kofleriaceae bacterium]|jgi:ligand-binding sensor domain-containing protein